jgi:MFS family permease
VRTPIRRVHTYPGYGHHRAAVRPAFTARLTARSGSGRKHPGPSGITEILFYRTARGISRPLAGLGLITAGLALLTLVPVQASYPTQVLPPLLIFGAGGGLCLPALASLGMSGATPADAGLASGLFNTTQQIGAALGVAVLSTLAAAQTRSQHSAGANTAAALAAGYHLAFAVGAGLAGTALVVAAAVLRPSRRRAVLAECC